MRNVLPLFCTVLTFLLLLKEDSFSLDLRLLFAGEDKEEVVADDPAHGVRANN